MRKNEKKAISIAHMWARSTGRILIVEAEILPDNVYYAEVGVFAKKLARVRGRTIGLNRI